MGKTTITVETEGKTFLEALEEFIYKYKILQNDCKSERLQGTRYDSKEEFKKKITIVLKELGIPADLLGYTYIREAIMIINEKGVVRASKGIYQELAKRFENSDGNIERSIRYAIEFAYRKGNKELIDKIFLNSVPKSKGKITNIQFIFMLADYLQQQ